jgi:hypothetical protein
VTATQTWLIVSTAEPTEPLPLGLTGALPATGHLL